MRKIRIDADVESIADEFQLELDKHKTEILQAIRELKEKFDGSHSLTRKGTAMDAAEVKKCYDYIDQLENDYDNGSLTLMKPNDFEKTHQTYKGYLKDQELKWSISIDRDKATPLHRRLTGAMGYQTIVRDEIYPPLMRKMGIKACVYCNANYTVSAEKGSGKGYFELDHWKPESKYPFLCTSFYNLQPCCPHCNKRKSASDKYEFLKLYEEDQNVPLDVFEFQITKGSIVRYFNKLDTSHIKVSFKATDASVKKLRNDAEQKFGIEGIYNEHIDVIEEMLWRAKFYDNVIVGSMTWLYGKRNSIVDVARFKLGTYAEEDEIHKRPLTKMMQDLGKQLGII
ncbi:MAG: HNH endonuclease [Bacteroidales bacterium]|nr:HNH endonuclease [Bacteroidales bacterium]